MSESQPVREGSDPSSARCPACHRPIAVAGQRCTYCRAALPATALTASEDAANATQPERCLIVIDTTASVDALAAALGRQATDVQALIRRGPRALHRILPAAEAAVEAARLTALGVSAVLLPEADVRAASRPLTAIGGDPERRVFSLDPGGVTCEIGEGEVFLVLWGPIRREPQSRMPRSWRALRRAPRSRVAEAELFHLHLRSRRQPIEVDPSTFVFSTLPGRVASSQLRLRKAIAELAAPGEIDRAFCQTAPALGLSAAAMPSPLATAPPSAEPNKPQREPAVFLDNLAQFRFYSAWRGVLARHLAGLAVTSEPPL